MENTNGLVDGGNAIVVTIPAVFTRKDYQTNAGPGQWEAFLESLGQNVAAVVKELAQQHVNEAGW